MEDLLKTIKIDKQYRLPGVEEGLYQVEQLQRDAKWDFCLPTIYYYKNHIKFNLPNDMDDFQERIDRMYSFLSNFNWNNCLLAGGCLSYLVGNIPEPEETVVDLDIFFYGCNEEQAIEKIRQIAGSFPENSILTFIRSKHAMTMVIDQTKIADYHSDQPIHIQFIFRSS